MKKIVLTALSASLLVVGTGSTYAIHDTTDYAEKTAYEQSKSSQMRLEYYNKYKAKGYDVSSLTAYLDGSKTTESQFWEALKVVQNNHEVPQRREYVAKLKAKGYDVSVFTEAVILDSGKFWEVYKALESGTKPATTEVKKETEKKVEVKAKVEEKKTEVVTKVTQSQNERLRTLMKARIAKLPAESRDATLARLETVLKSAIESARAKGAKVLASRYEVLLSVVQEEMNNIDDEALINSLFAQ